MAAAGRLYNLETVGLVRGEERRTLNPTLTRCAADGMAAALPRPRYLPPPHRARFSSRNAAAVWPRLPAARRRHQRPGPARCGRADRRAAPAR
ncbi:MAG: hypothetical protein WKG07_05895 [Hymenobacter sp.]